jgi:hypothetical protein
VGLRHPIEAPSQLIALQARPAGSFGWHRELLAPRKGNTINLRAFVLIIKPLIPASCLQCFVSILCFNQNQTPTPIHPGIGGSPQPHETPSLRADHRLTQVAGSRHQPREFHNLFSSLLTALLRQAHSSFLLFL